MSNRLQYYFRQLVTESELNQGFQYAEDADHVQMTDLSFIGVLSGMTVTQRGAGANYTVDISAGKTYDKNGQRIQFTSTQNVDVSVDELAVSTAVSGSGHSKILSVFAKFVRTLTDPRTDGNSVTVYFQEAESFAFVVRQGTEAVSPSPPALDGTFILLADITRTFGDTSITNGMIGTTRREDCFVHTGSTYNLRRGLVKDALSDLLDDINTNATNIATNTSGLAAHIASTTAHTAAHITYAGSGNWADGSTHLTATDVEGALDMVVSQLAASTGTGLIGGAAIGAVNNFGITAASLSNQIAQMVDYLDKGPLGMFPRTITSGSSPYTLSGDRLLYVDTTGGPVQVNLLNPASLFGQMVRIIDSKGNFGTNACTIHRFGAEKINGIAADKVLTAPWGNYCITNDKTDWYM